MKDAKRREKERKTKKKRVRERKITRKKKKEKENGAKRTKLLPDSEKGRMGYHADVSTFQPVSAFSVRSG